jgi:carboxypeptidase C (cathepsin A)
MKNSSFLNNLREEVVLKSSMYKKVLIFGHSYGGLIANRLAEELHRENNENNHKIQIATLGSIYIASPDSVQNINIVNYQSLGDLSGKFNGDKEPEYDDLKHKIHNISFSTKNPQNVIYVCISSRENPRCTVKDKSFFGSSEEWNVHTNYTGLTDFLVVTHTNSLI